MRYNLRSNYATFDGRSASPAHTRRKSSSAPRRAAALEAAALEAARRAADLDPTAAHFTLLGDTLSRGEQREEAAAAYERALALDPNDDRAKQALERLNRLDRPDSGR